MTKKPKDRSVGPWEKDKLDALGRYLTFYTAVLKNQDHWLRGTIFVDAFAGPGLSRVRTKGRTNEPPGLFGPDPESDKAETEFLKGSPRVVARHPQPFHRVYFFVERDLERIRELKALKAQYPSPRSITVKEGDANAALQEWLASGIDWSRHRAVVFLDPFGMQVPWSTIEALAKTKAMELIINFPLGMAIQRLLPKSGEYSARLANVAGHILWLTGVARTCLRGGRGPLRAQSAEGHRIGTKAAGLVSKPLAHRVWPRIDGAPHQGHSSKPSLLLDLGGPKRDG